jgi:hypothetical protein
VLAISAAGHVHTEQQRRRDTVVQAALQPMAPWVRSEFSIK